MTIREAIARVTTAYNRGVGSDDSALRNRAVYSKLKDAYADLLNDPRLRVKVDDFSKTTIDCVELCDSTPYECGCLPDLGCVVKRSKYKLPKPIFNQNKLQFGPVRTIDGSTEYTILAQGKVAYSKYAKYASKLEHAFIKNDYLYVVTSRDNEELVSITGVFADPFEVAEFKTICGVKISPCLSILDAEFPMVSDVQDKVINKVIEEMVGPILRTPKDEHNDGRDVNRTKP